MTFLRKYATLTVTGTTAIRIPIVKRSVVDFAVGADWVPAAGDVKILIDGTAAANVTNLPTAVPSGNTALWEFILTAAELTGKQSLHDVLQVMELRMALEELSARLAARNRTDEHVRTIEAQAEKKAEARRVKKETADLPFSLWDQGETTGETGSMFDMGGKAPTQKKVATETDAERERRESDMKRYGVSDHDRKVAEAYDASAPAK